MAINREQAVAAASRGASTRVAQVIAARFKVGDRIRIRNINPVGHTRVPRYIRGKVATIERAYGVFIFPDTHAAQAGEKPQHLYAARFSARELWGEQANPLDNVVVDVWDDYVDPI